MNSSVVSEMCRSLGSLPVIRSYSARVPRSSLARVRRVLVPHILEEEAEDPENEQDDRKEESQRVRTTSRAHEDGMECEMCAARQT